VTATTHLRAELDSFLEGVDWAYHRQRDPVGIVWEHEDPADQEVVALIAACLAYGQVSLFRAATRRCLSVLGAQPANALRTGEYDAAQLDGFVYRMTTGADVAALFRALAHALQQHRCLGGLFREGFLEEHADYRPALTHFVHALRRYGESSRRGFHYLLPDPAKGGACKRLNLFLRWMVRGPDAIDLGLWPLPANRLVMPLDTHVTRIAGNLGLSTRATQDWKLAVEIRDALARLAPEDPLKYDFALCHLGISGQCPRRRDIAICCECPIQTVCTL
jgi:uncharacterized protein (TIGR02757 family)